MVWPHYMIQACKYHWVLTLKDMKKKLYSDMWLNSPVFKEWIQFFNPSCEVMASVIRTCLDLDKLSLRCQIYFQIMAITLIIKGKIISNIRTFPNYHQVVQFWINFNIFSRVVLKEIKNFAIKSTALLTYPLISMLVSAQHQVWSFLEKWHSS